MVVTGASAGVGAAAAHEFARRGWRVLVTGRSPAKLAAVVGSVRRRTGVDVESLPADFARLADVRKLAAWVADRCDRVDVLANNAGLLPDRQVVTADGHELAWQVNHLAPFLLTHLLADRLGVGSRVVTTSSAAHRAGRLDLSDPEFQRRRWGRWRAYSASKMANVAFTRELSDRLAATGAVATCFHPGVVRSDFGRSFRLFGVVGWLPGFVSAERAAGRLVALATDNVGLSVPGGYFVRGRPATPVLRGGPDLPARLWELSLRQTGEG